MARDTYRKLLLPIALTILHVTVGVSQCLPPTLVQASSTSTDSISIQWLYFGSAAGWEMELVPRGATPTLAPTTAVITAQQYTFTDLDPATAYTIFIRTVCDDDNTSEWNPITVRTDIPQPSPCLFDLPIKNNNCSQGLESFKISVEDTPGLLGEDLFLSSVEVIIEHTWPADIDLRLISPSGREVSLSQNNGTVTDHYGDVTDADCEAVTIFSDLACEAISKNNPPFVGIFTPETPLFDVEDGTEANGIWSLSMCDRSDQDVGTLRYAQLVFEPLLCEIPRDILVKAVDARQVEVVWSSYEGCELTEVELTLQGDPNSIRTTSVPCQQEFVVIDGLEPNTAYDIYVLSNCLANLKSPLSCPFSFTTACTEVTAVETFDQQERCTPGCSFDCDVQGSWSNMQETDDLDWIVWDQRTDTDDTGPLTGAFGGGSYVYVEASPDICQPFATAQLTSACVTIVSTPEQCDLSFWYHMSGIDIGSLALLLQSNEAAVWDTVFTIAGDQGDEWHNEVISLQDYDGSAGRFQFVATTAEGSRGDIAIDQIEFRGSSVRPQGYTYYQDLDQDGYGNEAFAFNLCTTVAPPSLVDRAGDCIDNDENINPDAEEIPCNTIDENCNGPADDNPTNDPIVYEATITEDLCTQPNSGGIVLEVVAGVGPFTYTWSNDSTGSTLQNIAAGSYHCTIEDGQACSIVTEEFVVPELGGVLLVIDSINAASCNGKPDGYMSVTASLGTGPYTYAWSDGTVGSDYPSAPAGTYQVVATDSMGCTSDSLTVVLPTSGSIAADISFMVPPSCFGSSNGILQADALSGSSPHDYVWSSGEETKLITGKPAGTYACTITDSNGCNTVLTAILPNPPELLTDIVSQENVECFGGVTGSIKTAVNGGQPPYTFEWSTGQKTDDIFDLSAGSYVLTVTDANACTASTDTVLISEPPQLLTQVDSALFASCILSSDGYLSIATEGGTGAYSYFWSSIPADSAVVANATPGIYNVTVTDANNCKTTINNYQLDADDLPLTITTALLGANNCADDSLVQIAATSSDGSLPLDFNWSSGQQRLVSTMTDTLSQLPAGIYNVTVTDARGCIGISERDTVESATPITLAVQVEHNSNCPDDENGAISVIASGGSPPYRYQWSNGDTDSTTDSLRIGRYKVTVTDSNNCTVESQAISVNGPAPFEVLVSTTPAGATNDGGSITLSVSGASSPYNYIWPDGIAATSSPTASGLAAASYGIVITDSNSCDTAFVVTVPLSSDVIDISRQGLMIYPVPTSDHITIASDYAPIIGYEVYDSAGRLVLADKTEASQQVTLETFTMHTGVYVVTVHLQSGTYQLRFVKV